MFILFVILIGIIMFYCINDYTIVNKQKSNVIVNSDHFITNNKKLSRKCPHAGCNVNYNKLNNEFVCPCHNSRFNIDGDVLQGPATSNLAAY